MNKTYIKRQLTLNELGIPMDEDIQMYYNLFNELIGDVNELLGISSLRNKRTYWLKNNKIILEYNNNGNYINVCSNIWHSFSKLLANEKNEEIIIYTLVVLIGNQIKKEIEFAYSMWWFDEEHLDTLE